MPELPVTEPVVIVVPEQTKPEPILPERPVTNIIVMHPVRPEVPNATSAPKPEVGSSKRPVLLPMEPEEKTSEPEDYSSIPEEKASTRPEERTSAPKPEVGKQKRRKLKKFSGAGGRIHTEAQIDEILDFWLMTGELPNYVSERQRWSYRHHERVPERRELLEQRGISIVANIPGATGHSAAVIPIRGGNSQRKNSAI